MQPPDSPKAALVHQWLSKARRDLDQADRAAQPPPFLDDVVFHCQQAAEKALKAFLIWHDRAFRKTHNLQELVQQCAEILPELSELRDVAVTLTPFAWEYRYPGDFLEPTPEAAAEARALATRCVEVVQASLFVEIGPG
jgi:HEPN domain-containing protein